MKEDFWVMEKSNPDYKEPESERDVEFDIEEVKGTNNLNTSVITESKITDDIITQVEELKNVKKVETTS